MSLGMAILLALVVLMVVCLVWGFNAAADLLGMLMDAWDD